MLLKGGVSQTGGGAGAGAGSGAGAGGFGGFGGGTPWGMIAQQINQSKANLRNTFADAADNANATALAASNFRTNFSPIAGNFIAPQNMQTQQSQMSNLYNYLMR